MARELPQAPKSTSLHLSNHASSSAEPQNHIVIASLAISTIGPIYTVNDDRSGRIGTTRKRAGGCM